MIKSRLCWRVQDGPASWGVGGRWRWREWGFVGDMDTAGGPHAPPTAIQGPFCIAEGKGDFLIFLRDSITPGAAVLGFPSPGHRPGRSLGERGRGQAPQAGFSCHTTVSKLVLAAAAPLLSPPSSLPSPLPTASALCRRHMHRHPCVGAITPKHGAGPATVPDAEAGGCDRHGGRSEPPPPPTVLPEARTGLPRASLGLTRPDTSSIHVMRQKAQHRALL